ncbi:MAG: DNA repair protein RecO [Myxococcales bacterium]|nr:DNA repair protein RecO [Myxococcales bacterium]
MERFRERALVLSTLDYGDADRLATLFTAGRGKLTAFAAGARKSKRRFAGALEPFTLLQVQLVERRGETYRLDAAEVEATFPAVRADLPRIARALYSLELCRELLREREPHLELFELLLAYLEALEGGAGPTSLVGFELSALARAGLMPRFSPCAVCGGPTGERPRFDPDHGGVVCEGCAWASPQSVPMSPTEVEALRALQAGARTPLPRELRHRARALLNLFIAHHLGRKLKSVDFLSQVGFD